MAQELGTNVRVEVTGNKMVITVDLSQEHGLSTSGKTTVIATTSGSKPVMTDVGQVLVGVNINKKKK